MKSATLVQRNNNKEKNSPELNRFREALEAALQGATLPKEYRNIVKNIGLTVAATLIAFPASFYYVLPSPDAAESTIDLFQDIFKNFAQYIAEAELPLTVLLTFGSFYVNFFLGIFSFFQIATGENRSWPKRGVASTLVGLSTIQLVGVALKVHTDSPAWQRNLALASIIPNMLFLYVCFSSAVDKIAGLFSSKEAKELDKSVEDFKQNIKKTPLLKSFMEKYGDIHIANIKKISYKEVAKHFTPRYRTVISYRREFLALSKSMIPGFALFLSTIVYETNSIFATAGGLTETLTNPYLITGLSIFGVLGFLYMSLLTSYNTPKSFYTNTFEKILIEENKDQEVASESTALVSATHSINDQAQHIKKSSASSSSLAFTVAPILTRLLYSALFFAAIFSYGNTFLTNVEGWEFFTTLPLWSVIVNFFFQYTGLDLANLTESTEMNSFLFSTAEINCFIINFLVSYLMNQAMAPALSNAFGCNNKGDKKLVDLQTVLEKDARKIVEFGLFKEDNRNARISGIEPASP